MNLSKKVISNSVVNLVTQIIPILLALFFIPISIKLLGSKLFGVYTLIVTFIVLFNYLNFGIAPATTKELARFLAINDYKKVSSIFINSFMIMFTIGLLFSVIFFFFHNNIALFLIKEKDLSLIVSEILYLFSFLSPLLMIVIFLRSTLEAKHNFLVTSLNRAFLNSMIFVSPIIVYFDNFNIISIFKFLIFVYSVSVIVLSYIVYKEYPIIKQSYFSIKDIKDLFNIGFWMMLSSLAGIGLYYTDRFIISATISTIAVAYYAAAYDMITRLNIISGSITSALFPAFSHWYEIKEKESIKNSVIFVTKVILFLVSFIGLITIAYSKEILNVWINNEYAVNSYNILQILTIGVLFNTLSVIPFRTLSAIGFQKMAAMVYILEVPFTIFLVYILIITIGLKGAAISYTIRAFIEMIIMFYLLSLNKIQLDFKFNKTKILSTLLVYTSLYLFAYAIFNLTYGINKIILIIILVIILFVAQYFIFDDDEKNEIFQIFYKIKDKLWKK